MKRSKTVLSLLLAFSILLSGGYSVHSAAAPVSKTDKEVFAEECDRLYWGRETGGENRPKPGAYGGNLHRYCHVYGWGG